MNGKTVQLASAAGTVVLGGDLVVHRLGFGAMRLTGEGVWGPPKGATYGAAEAASLPHKSRFRVLHNRSRGAPSSAAK
jgi:hypothetical protein